MSSIKLSPNASGTGEFTIAAPNSNTNRTLTLPDQTGTVLTNAGPFTANASASAGAVTIDASNNVGIGTSSPTSRLHLYGSAPTIKLQHSATGSQGVLRWVDSGGTDRGGIASYYNVADTGNLEFLSGSTTRMTLDSSGRLLVGTTSVGNNGVSLVPDGTSYFYSGGTNTLNIGRGTNDGTVIQFQRSGTNCGSISVTTTTTTYATSSDYRLKQDVQPMTGALARVAALKPVTYKWKSDGSDGHGFIAHELQAVVPDAVVGEKDAVDADGNPVYQGIDTSFLVATLTAALQELNAKVEAQAAEIAALKGVQ